MSDIAVARNKPGQAAEFTCSYNVGLQPGWSAQIGGKPEWPERLPGIPFSRELPFIRVYGEWREEEFRHLEHGGVHLLLIGHCLLSAARVAEEFSAALDAGILGSVAGWPGSYTAVAIEGGGVTVFTDLAGQFPVYCSRRGDQTLIGSDPGVLAAAHLRRVDPITAAARIACPDVLPLWSRRSPYEAVQRLEGGDVLRASRCSVDIDRQIPVPRTSMTMLDAARSLRAALEEGVWARCEHRIVSSDFSGGLDSTSIAYLAARHSEQPVRGLIYHQPLAPAADLADAVHCSRLESGIQLIVVRGSADALPYRGLGQALAKGEKAFGVTPRSAEPAPGSLSWRSAALRLARAAATNADVHLTGEGGDALLMSAPSYLAALARPSSVITMLRHCAAYARLRNVSPARLAGRAALLARTDASAALQSLAAELERPDGRQARWSDVISWWSPCREASTWLTARTRRQMAEIAADPVTARAIPAGLEPADMAALTGLRNSADAQRDLAELGRRFGLAVHAPMLDNAVIRAALSTSAASRADPRSYKPLLRAALAGVVPDEIFSRRTKGDYAAEDYQGARLEAPALRDLLRDSRLAALGVIEPRAALAALERMISGVAVPLGPLNMLLATELWLRMADHDYETRNP